MEDSISDLTIREVRPHAAVSGPAPVQPVATRTLVELVVDKDTEIQPQDDEDVRQHRVDLRKLRAESGRRHPDTLTAMHDLGGALYAQDRYYEAQQLLERCLTEQEAALHPGHPEISRTLEILGHISYTGSNHAEAEAYYSRGFTNRKLSFGPQHPDTLLAKSYLIQALMEQDLPEKQDESRRLYEECLPEMEAVLGLNHKDVVRLLEAVAHAVYGERKYEEAENLYTRVYNRRVSSLGNRHPDTQRAKSEMIQAIMAQGPWEKQEHGRKLFESSLPLMEEVLGRDDLDILVTWESLGQVYHRQSRYVDSERTYARVFNGRKASLGDRHPHTLRARNELIRAIMGQGRNVEAQKLLEECLPLMEDALGPNDPETLYTLDSLGQTLFSQQKYVEAVKVNTRELERRRVSQGEQHPDTVNAKGRLDMALTHQNRLYEQVRGHPEGKTFYGVRN